MAQIQLSIFFNKQKIKTGRSEQRNTRQLPPPTSDNISFLPYHPHGHTDSNSSFPLVLLFVLLIFPPLFGTQILMLFI